MGNKHSHGGRRPANDHGDVPEVERLTKVQRSLLLRAIDKLTPSEGNFSMDRPSGFLTPEQARAVLDLFSRDGGISLGPAEVDELVMETLNVLGFDAHLEVHSKKLDAGLWSLDADRDGRLSEQDLTGAWFLTTESAREVIAETTGFESALVEGVLGYLGCWSRWEMSSLVDPTYKPGAAPASGWASPDDAHDFPHLELHPHPHNVPRGVDIVTNVIPAGRLHMPAHVGLVTHLAPKELSPDICQAHFLGTPMKDSESHSHVGGLLLGFRLGQEQPTQVFAGHSRPVRSFADIGNAAHPFVLTSAGDGTIRIWPTNSMDPVVESLRTIRVCPTGQPASQMATTLCRLTGLDDFSWASGHLDGSVRLWSYPELTDSQGLIRNVWPRLRSLLRGDPGLLELALERLLEHRRKQVGAQAGGGGQGADNARRELEEEARRELETVARRATPNWASVVLRGRNAWHWQHADADVVPRKVTFDISLLDAGRWDAAFAEESQLGFGSLEEALAELEEVCKTDPVLLSRLGQDSLPSPAPNDYNLSELDFVGSQFLFNENDPFLQRHFNPFPETAQILLEDQPPAPGQPLPDDFGGWQLQAYPGDRIMPREHPYNNIRRGDVDFADAGDLPLPAWLQRQREVEAEAARQRIRQRLNVDFGNGGRHDWHDRARFDRPQILRLGLDGDDDADSTASVDSASQSSSRRSSVVLGRFEEHVPDPVEPAVVAGEHGVGAGSDAGAVPGDGTNAGVAADDNNNPKQEVADENKRDLPEDAGHDVDREAGLPGGQNKGVDGLGEHQALPQPQPSPLASSEPIPAGSGPGDDLPAGPDAKAAEDEEAEAEQPQQEEHADWACPQCTLLNPAQIPRCEACDFVHRDPLADAATHAWGQDDGWHLFGGDDDRVGPDPEPPAWRPRPLAVVLDSRRMVARRLLDHIEHPLDGHNLFLTPLGPGHLLQAAPGLRCWAQDSEGVWRPAVITAVARARELVQVHYLGTFASRGEWIDARLESYRLRDPAARDPRQPHPHSPVCASRAEIVEANRMVLQVLEAEIAAPEFVERYHQTIFNRSHSKGRPDLAAQPSSGARAVADADTAARDAGQVRGGVCGTARRHNIMVGGSGPPENGVRDEKDDEAKEAPPMEPGTGPEPNLKAAPEKSRQGSALETELRALDPSSTELGRRVFRLLLRLVEPTFRQLLPRIPDGPASVSCELLYRRHPLQDRQPQPPLRHVPFPRTTEFTKLSSARACLLAVTHSHRTSLRVLDPDSGRPVFAFPELERAHAGALLSALVQVGPTDDPDFVWLASGDRRGAICVWELPLTARGAEAQRRGICAQKREWAARVAETERLNRERRRTGSAGAGGDSLHPQAPLPRPERPVWRPTRVVGPPGESEGAGGASEGEAGGQEQHEEIKETQEDRARGTPSTPSSPPSSAPVHSVPAMREAVLLHRMVAVGPENWRSLEKDPSRRRILSQQPVMSLRCTEEGLLMSAGTGPNLNLWDWRTGRFFSTVVCSGLTQEVTILGEQLGFVLVQGGPQVSRLGFSKRI